MLLEPKPVPKMELTEEMARNLLAQYCLHRNCDDECLFNNDAGCAISKVIIDSLRDNGRRKATADEVFAAVRELAGGATQ